MLNKYNVCLIWLLNSLSFFSYGEDYPFRKDYPDIKIMNTKELYQSLDKCLVVDVRSKLEFSIIHIANSINIPLSQRNFEKLVVKEKEKTKKTCVVFYCNGHTCIKSYQASEKILPMASYSYDAGVFDWATAYSKKTILLGNPMNTPDQLISKKEFEQYEITAEEVLPIISNFKVIDTRSYFQRKDKKLPFGHYKRVSMTQIRPLLKLGLIKDEKLLFIDAVGSQNKWLHYYLKEYGYTNYQFLKGGAAAFN